MPDATPKDDIEPAMTPAMMGREATPTWCDGTPHNPTAIPPLPLHDFRWSGDDPYIECARCGRIERDGRVIFEGRLTPPARQATAENRP